MTNIPVDSSTHSTSGAIPLTSIDAMVVPVDTPEENTVARSMPDEDATDEVLEARSQVEETRAHLTETIDAIKDRLSPSALIAEAKESAKEATMEVAQETVEKAQEIVGTVVDKAKDVAATASDVIHNAADYVTEKTTPMMESAKQQLAPAVDAARNLGVNARGAGETIVDTIRANPIPVALIAIGVGWLLAGPRRSYSVGDNYNLDKARSESDLMKDPNLYSTSSNSYNATSANSNGISTAVHNASDAVSDFASNTKDKMSDMASSAKQQASDLAVNAQQRASDLASAAKQQADTLATATKEKTQATVSFIDQWVHDEPLAAGAIALLVGAAVGLALPGTDKENELFGAKRDELAQRATETAQEMAGKVQNVAQNVLGTAKDALHTATDQIKTDFKQEAQNNGLVAAS